MQLRMKVVRGKPKGHHLVFPPGEFMFGRGPECDVRPNSELVSRQHCLLRITKDDVSIRDLGSTNGTLVNGKLVLGQRKLGDGDIVQLGPMVLEIVIDARADESVRDIGICDTALQDQLEETQLNSQPLIP